MRKSLKLILVALTTLTLSHCGFKPIDQVVHLPFSSAEVISNDASWAQRLKLMLTQFNIKTGPSSSLKIVTNKPLINQNTTTLDSSGDARSTTYTASATVKITRKNTVITQHTLSASQSSFEQSTQLQSAYIPSEIKNQLQDQLISSLTFWLASDQFKKAISQHHAN